MEEMEAKSKETKDKAKEGGKVKGETKAATVLSDQGGFFIQNIKNETFQIGAVVDIFSTSKFPKYSEK